MDTIPLKENDMVNLNKILKNKKSMMAFIFKALVLYPDLLTGVPAWLVRAEEAFYAYPDRWDKIAAVKSVRADLELGLLEAKNLVESLINNRWDIEKFLKKHPEYKNYF